MFAVLHRFSLGDLRHLRFVQTSIPVNSAVGKITVHTVDLRQIPGTAYRTHIHFQFLMSAVVTVCKREIHALIISQIHGSADESADRFFIIAYRITYILDLSAVAQLPEAPFQILLLDRSNVLCHMAVETVAHIRTIGNAFHYPVHLAELLYLKAAETLCRRSVDRIKVAVLLFELVHLVVDIFQHIQSELAVLSERLADRELLQLVQGRISK